MPTALLSVFDKTGIVALAAALHAAGWRIVSSGGTAKAVAEAGVPVTDLVELTGLPAILDHRVVTLHPKVHGGLLADPTNPGHQADMAEHDIEAIDLVVVNLYPFTSNPSIELIDIGGPAMVRAAAKNHAHVGVVVNPADYALVKDEVAATGVLSAATRRRLARDAFATIAAYDAASKRGNERFELESYGRTGETKQDGLGSEFDQLGITQSAGRRTGGEHERGAEMGGGSATAQRGTTGHQLDRTDTIDSQLGNNNNKGLQGHGQSGEQHDAKGWQGAQRHNPASGFWIDCDWLPCRDGRSRPVEPGTFPLAHGISGRVGRLRAYGNAIVPQVAQTFIEAYLES